MTAMSEAPKLDNRESLIIHIEGLQATLAKRNQRIAELEERLKHPEHITTQMEQRHFKAGWEACSNHLVGATHRMAAELAKVRREALNVYWQGERLEDSNDGDE